MRVGDLIQATESMQRFGYHSPAIIINKYNGRYILAFSDGTIAVFHPSHLKPVKK